jgi:hypothetical protein
MGLLAAHYSLHPADPVLSGLKPEKQSDQTSQKLWIQYHQSPAGGP